MAFLTPNRTRRYGPLTIKISLAPPSPPLASPLGESDPNLLRIPGLTDERPESPPPDRRDSTVSTCSSDSFGSTALPYSESYQNLLLSPRPSVTPELMPDVADLEMLKPVGRDSPQLLSPILARPVIARSLSAQANWRQASESEVELLGYWTSSPSPTRGLQPLPSDTPGSPVLFPRSASAARLQLLAVGGGVGSPPTVRNAMLNRTESDVCDRRRMSSMRRLSAAVPWNLSGAWHGLSTDSPPSGSMSSLLRLRNSSLGHSCPQLSALSGSSQPPVYSAVKLRKELRVKRRHSHRMSRGHAANASTSPIMPPRCRSPARGQQLVRPSTQRPESALLLSAPSHPRTAVGGARSALTAFNVPDTRRWSVASLPSSSGYGTPGSNSAMSSQYSSQERLAGGMEELRISTARQRFDSNDSYPGVEDLSFRPRSRSLNHLAWLNLSSDALEISPVKMQHDSSVEMALRSNVYKERFPKAKQQMEMRLEEFISKNSPLSGPLSFTSGQAPSAAGGSEIPFAARLLADGSTRFLHHQIVELANDCLLKSRDNLMTSSYFCDMSQSLEDTICEAREKTPPDSFAYLSDLVKQLLIIVARPARLLECLEFDPEEFYQLLEEAEGQVREQLEPGACVPDLPQYIVSKLGLDKDPLEPEKTPPFMSAESPDLYAFDFADAPTSAYLNEAAEDSAAQGSDECKLPTDRPPCEDDFESIKLISNGAYGAVFLVRHRDTRQRFALKKLNKSNLALRNQIDQVFAERDILTFIDNPFVVSFYGSFETRRHLCMLLEYVEGGDCATLLKNVQILPVDLGRLYIAETLLAIEYLHSYGIVHRDIKPDNLLITAMGHIKLTDFGLSKIGLMNRTTLMYEGYVDVTETQQFQDKQLCGTPEYIAPEVILRQGYGKPVDWWALGIILYEFLVGAVPFFGDTPEELFAHVVSDQIEWPDEEPYDVPEEAKDLVHSLLTQNPLERLGTLNGAAEVKLHPFFVGLCWNTLLRQKAEFVPNLEGEEDTSYFDTRAERYNHELEYAEEEGSEDSNSGSPMFLSFSSCASPRHSIVMDPNVQSPLSGPERDRKCSAQSQSSVGSSVGAHSEESVESGIAVAELEGIERSRTGSSNEPQIPMAVLLRRRFSNTRSTAPRATTGSSSSSGTGTPGLSSTDSMDTPPLLNVDDDKFIRRRTKTAPSPMLPTFSVTCDPHHDTVASAVELLKELSPVDERQMSPELQESDSTMIPSSSYVDEPPPAVVLRRNRTSSLRKLSPSSPSGMVSKSQSLHLVIPPTSPPRVPPPSPSNSSVSSRDGSPGRTAQEISPKITSLKPPITIRRGPKGFGFTLRSVRVYLGADSDYYTIQHIVTHVDPSSPAFDAGLRGDDLITHVNGDAVQNLTHPQLMQRLLSFGDHLSLRVTALENTSIKTGAPRKSAGKMARKKGHRQNLQRRVLEKKRRASLLRRLSGKRVSSGAELSSQKQTFIPRSVSTQDSIGVSVTQLLEAPAGPALKRMSDVGLGAAANTSTPAPPQSPTGSRPSTLQGLGTQLKHKISASLRAPTRRKSAQGVGTPMPVSPLARTDSSQPAPLSAPLTAKALDVMYAPAPQTQPLPPAVALEPNRSPSPLAAGCQPSTAKRGSSTKKSVTKPGVKSDSRGSSPQARKGNSGSGSQPWKP